MVAKGDGMTSDKPALPSEQRPNAGKLARTPSNPGTPATIETKADIDRHKFEAEEAIERANPSLGLWKRIRQELQREGGDASAQ